MIIPVNLGKNSYDIVVERGSLTKAADLLNLNRKVLVVTDSGVPSEYAATVAEQCGDATVVTIPQGEESKCFDIYRDLLKKLLEKGFTRTDCVVAVGGGVVGDLAGFVAASFMRGIDFYNIPTTLLSQIDSSIGGKVAIDFEGIKNIVGAFYQPKKVVIDPQVLSTLPQRQISNGLAEAIKMSVTSDRELFELLENEDIWENIDTVIVKSLNIKKDVVEQDEKEKGLRKILNFGHTIGHGIESAGALKELYHGECVALGMLPMCGENVKNRLENVLKKAGLPTDAVYDKDKVCVAMLHDKKMDGKKITVIKSDEIGSFIMEAMSVENLEKLIKD